ncbi:MAG: UbiA prenyltransferase family protein [Planctomycetota bacterium]
MIGPFLRLARPWHWVKNVFVLVPVPFALRAGGAEPSWGLFCLGLFGFCLVNSSVYAFNDVMDAEADRRHPTKKNRPVASGAVSPAAACLFSLLLAAAGMTLIGMAPGGGGILALPAVYIGANILYSLGGKHFALLDVFLLSSGFVIRVLLGVFLMAVPASQWILLCSSALALFLGLTKRRADLAAGLGPEHRPSLAGYNLAFLDQAMGIMAGVSLLCYAIYSITSEVMLPGRELASMPFVAFAILNYLRIAHIEGSGGSPVEVAFTDRPSQICGLGWVLAIAWSLGFL